MGIPEEIQELLDVLQIVGGANAVILEMKVSRAAFTAMLFQVRPSLVYEGSKGYQLLEICGVKIVPVD